MTRCPVCGMNMEDRMGRKVVYKGRTYQVATDVCKERFEADPAKYAVSDHTPDGQEVTHDHGCC